MSREASLLRNLADAIDRQARIESYMELPSVKEAGVHLTVEFYEGSACIGASEVKRDLSEIATERCAVLMAEVRRRAAVAVEAARAALLDFQFEEAKRAQQGKEQQC